MLRSAEIKKLYMHVNISDEKEVKEAEAAVLTTVKVRAQLESYLYLSQSSVSAQEINWCFMFFSTF